MLPIPDIACPVVKLFSLNSVEVFIKREDTIHSGISGNKYWKLFHNINTYIGSKPKTPMLISFGGAYSNHIAALSTLGKISGIPTLGIIRGEELENRWQDNPTLLLASRNGMSFLFVSREAYKDKIALSERLKVRYPEALIIPEGGTNSQAVNGIANMLNQETEIFDYLCTAVGTGGTVAGISKFAKNHQTVLGLKVVKDSSLFNTVLQLSKRNNFKLIDASFGGYGKIHDSVVNFINDFLEQYSVPLDPIYTGKMMMTLLRMIQDNYFPSGSKILVFHTGGLQAIDGANEYLKKKKKDIIIKAQK